jgi:hypothetical protein
MIIIDGIRFNVPVLKVTRKADFLDKYAKRTESGELQRELIGVYFNYQLKLGTDGNRAEYARLWQKLTEPQEFHSITVPDENGDYTFQAYASNVGDELIRAYKGHYYFDNLTVNFTAKSPARR